MSYAICPTCNQWMVTDPDCNAAVRGCPRRMIALPSGREIPEDLLHRWQERRFWKSDWVAWLNDLPDEDINYIDAEWLAFKRR